MKKVCTQCGTEFDTVDRGSAAKTCSDECSCERKLKRSRERMATDPEFRESILEYQRERYATDHEFRERKLKRSREYRRERYATDPEFRERIREYRRERMATDPEFRERELKRDREKHREINARCRVGRLLVIQDQLKQAMA